MIHFHEVQKTVGDQEVFANLTLFLPKASYTLICGAAHSGKTTLVRMITGNEMPDAGTLRVDGMDVGNIPQTRIPYLRRQIGLVAETPALLEARTVADNISVPLQLAGFDQRNIKQRLDATLELTGLQDEKDIEVNRLTVAVRQLVSVARATIHKPPIVVADEPLQHMDSATNELIINLFNNANAYGATVLVTCKKLAPFSHALLSTANVVTLSEGSIQSNESQRDKDIIY